MKRIETIKEILQRETSGAIEAEILEYIEEAVCNLDRQQTINSVLGPLLEGYIEDENKIQKICSQVEDLYEQESFEKRKPEKNRSPKSESKRYETKDPEENDEQEEEDNGEDSAQSEEEVVEITSNQNSYARVATGKNRTVNLDGFSLCHGTNVLIGSAKLLLLHGHRYGVLGKNGCGKTTLMKKMAKKQIQNFPPHLSVSLVEQEIKGDERTVLQTVLAYDKELQELKEQEEKLLGAMEENEMDLAEAQEQLEEVYVRMEVKESHSAEERAKKILQGFGFDEEMMAMPTNSLSGGWRMKVSLCGGLFSKPDILCLDEPTNHLSLPNRQQTFFFAEFRSSHSLKRIWLQNFLKNSFRNTLVVVSHDVEFLKAVTTDIIQFKRSLTLEYFPVDYAKYLEVKENRTKHRNERAISQQRKFAALEEKINNIKQETMKKRKSNNNKKSMKAEVKGVKSLKSKIEKNVYVKYENGKKFQMTYGAMKTVLTPEMQERYRKFEFHKCSDLHFKGSILTVESLSFSHYKLSPLFEDVSFDVTAGEKIAIIGDNGVGKTTLLDLISRKVSQESGSIQMHHSVKVGYFTQHHIQQLDLSLTPMQYLSKYFPTMREGVLRSHLAKFGICDYIPLQKMKTLSGGEKSRVVFSTITMDQPHILLLDEPSNHLDIVTQQTLIQALKDFNGTVVLVSHDRSLITSVANKFLLIDNHKAKFLNSFQSFMETISKSNKK